MTTALAEVAGGTGFVQFDPAISVNLDLVADSAVRGTGRAVDPQAHVSMSATVTPTTAGASGKAFDGAGVVGPPTATPPTAGGTGQAIFIGGTLLRHDLVADNPVRVVGRALSPELAWSSRVVAATASAWGTAQGATLDGADSGLGGDQSPITDTTLATGSAFSARWRVTLRPATAGATGRVNPVVVMGLDRPRKPHAGTPRVIPGVVVGALVASGGVHVGEPALV